jgi:hypothetical protein
MTPSGVSTYLLHHEPDGALPWALEDLRTCERWSFADIASLAHFLHGLAAATRSADDGGAP